MRKAEFYCFLIISLIKSVAAASQDDEISQWIYPRIRALLKGCPSTPSTNFDQHQDFLSVLRYCLQHRTIEAVDTLLTNDVIPVVDGISLVRYKDQLQSNTTAHNESDGNRTHNIDDKNIPFNDERWQTVVMNRFTKLFRTHVLKIDLDQGSKLDGESYNSSKEDGDDFMHGRRRRHKNKGMMFPIMMMGFLFMGTVLIPMGFQFLAVLGGKALILAKMALMLSSIQGLKKIATSGMNYGLYHSPASAAAAAGWNDRSHQDTQAPIELPFQSYSRGQSNP